MRTLKRIGKIITAVGIGIMFFGGMCDADDIYYYYLIAVIALGALVSLAGLAIMSDLVLMMEGSLGFAAKWNVI